MHPYICGGPLERVNLQTMDVRELMSVTPSERGVSWLRHMLQWAVALELSTIPPYLYSRWSIRDQSLEIVDLLVDITREEMGHMGIACNLLRGLGGIPRLGHAAPRYPRWGFPGRVHPDLRISLKPLSKKLIRRLFMAIEQPDVAPIQFYAGQTYPTIGAFYSAIEQKLSDLSDDDFDVESQLSIVEPGHNVMVQRYSTPGEAIDAVRLIRAQGEGTQGSPEAEPGSGKLSHYWTFSEIAVGKHLQQNGSDWSYTGDTIDFPGKEGIRQLRPAELGECEESTQFDREYSQMLTSLEQAWRVGGDQGMAHFRTAADAMNNLRQLAFAVMDIPAPHGEKNLGPGFHFVF